MYEYSFLLSISFQINKMKSELMIASYKSQCNTIFCKKGQIKTLKKFGKRGLTVLKCMPFKEVVVPLPPRLHSFLSSLGSVSRHPHLSLSTWSWNHHHHFIKATPCRCISNFPINHTSHSTVSGFCIVIENCWLHIMICHEPPNICQTPLVTQGVVDVSRTYPPLTPGGQC